MSAGNAIIARLGLDTSSFNRDLAKTEAQTKASAQRMQRQQQAGFKALAGKALGGGELISGLEGALGLSLGGAALGATIATAIPKLIELRKEAEETRIELQKLLHPSRPAEFATLEDLEERVAGLQKKLKAASDEPSWKKFLSGLAEGSLTAGMGGTVAGAQSRQAEETRQVAAELAKTQQAIDAKKLDAKGKEDLAARAKVMKGISAEAQTAAEIAIKNMNAQISANQVLADQESERAGEKYDKEQEFQKLAEQGQAKTIQGIRDEQRERAAAALALATGIQNAANGIVGNAKETFVAGELGGPNERREAKRQARRAAAAGRKFDRLTKGIVPGLLDGIAGKAPNLPSNNPLANTEKLLGEIKTEITKLEIHNL